MKEKIKRIFSFIGSAWRGSLRGKIGLLLVLFSIFMFARMFVGERTIQGFAMNNWRLTQEQKQLAAAQENLDEVTKRIRLIQHHSPDYIEELSQKHLNLGDPKVRILR